MTIVHLCLSIFLCLQSFVMSNVFKVSCGLCKSNPQICVPCIQLSVNAMLSLQHSDIIPKSAIHSLPLSMVLKPYIWLLSGLHNDSAEPEIYTQIYINGTLPTEQFMPAWGPETSQRHRNGVFISGIIPACLCQCRIVYF